MNKNAQLMVVAIMIMVFVFVTAIILLGPLKDFIDQGRHDLGCNNMSNLSTGEASTCLIVDLYLPYFIGVVLAGSAAYVFHRISGGG